MWPVNEITDAAYESSDPHTRIHFKRNNTQENAACSDHKMGNVYALTIGKRDSIQGNETWPEMGKYSPYSKTIRKGNNTQENNNTNYPPKNGYINEITS